MKTKRVAIYCRVSTSEQSTDLQRKELSAFAEARGWSFSMFEENASGTTDRRPVFQDLVRRLKKREFDVLLCWKLDRCARSLRTLLTLLQDLTDVGVEFIALKDGVDLTTAAGKLQMQLLGAFAEFEASLIKERVLSGLKAAKARGVRLGRPPTEHKEDIAILRRQGLTYSQIAAKLGVSRSLVGKVCLSIKPTC